MPFIASPSRLWALPLFLLAGSCMNDPGGSGKPVVYGPSSGVFRVSLIAPSEGSPGRTTIAGRIYGGVTPSAVNWVEKGSTGACKVFTPTTPFCETSCGSGALCVADNTCKAFPKSISAGKVTVTGIKLKSGAAAFSMTQLFNNYQPGVADTLAYPPFADGDAVAFSAAGDSSVGAFKVTSAGIGLLSLLNDTITLADGKPITLKWTAPAKAGASVVSVFVDISHHGGSKGKIECEGPDNGSLEIAAGLVDQLKALGVSGFPKIEITRKSTGTNADVKVDLVLESLVSKELQIPGLISCGSTDDCPDGKTCQADLQCK
jgi:hypothetical protein